MQGGDGLISSLSISADGARVAGVHADADPSIFVWDKTGALLRTILGARRAHTSHVHFSTTDKIMLATFGGFKNDTIQLWNVESGERIRSFGGRNFAVFSPNGRTIATAGANFRDVLILGADSGTEWVRMVCPHGGIVLSGSFSVDGSMLASGCDNGACKVWDSSTGALLRTIDIDVGNGEGGNRLFSVSWGRDWVRDTREAFAMGQHPRLGAGSELLELEAGVVRMILDRI